MSVDYVSEVQIGNGPTYPLRDLLAMYRAEMLEAIFPVGTIHLSTTMSTAAQVAAAFGGTWEAWGQGRVPIGVDTTDEDFDTADATGGSKSDDVSLSGNVGMTALDASQLPYHSHAVGDIMARVPNLTSDYNDFVHSPYPVSAKLGRITSDSDSDYAYLRGGATGIGRSIGRSSVVINSKPYCTMSGRTAPTGEGQPHTHSLSEASVSVDKVQPYVTCYMWKRIA